MALSVSPRVGYLAPHWYAAPWPRHHGFSLQELRLSRKWDLHRRLWTSSSSLPLRCGGRTNLGAPTPLKWRFFFLQNAAGNAGPGFRSSPHEFAAVGFTAYNAAPGAFWGRPQMHLTLRGLHGHSEF